jgi:uncharacterized protein (DUF2141 family)
MIKFTMAQVGLLSIAALAFPITANAQTECQGPKSDTSIEVTVTGLRDAKGQIAVTLYADDSSRFLVKRGSMYTGRVSAVAPATTMCLYVPKPGVYALAVYHDANADRSLWLFEQPADLRQPALIPIGSAEYCPQRHDHEHQAQVPLML